MSVTVGRLGMKTKAMSAGGGVGVGWDSSRAFLSSPRTKHTIEGRRRGLSTEGCPQDSEKVEQRAGTGMRSFGEKPGQQVKAAPEARKVCAEGTAGPLQAQAFGPHISGHPGPPPFPGPQLSPFFSSSPPLGSTYLLFLLC